ncbi:hypothetical protein, variant 2 [Phytophthora nicotianae CJ01A1]|uniref:Uncharacterized protein n=6 Tax=Phytophthora nicotianae TaxID=4792 RepID=V9FQQ6_PHYNI|nr:hypothetical protein, variant 1 [Phytophthora nicotianae INRA-310]XP_008901085.1 hypothetical protein, variant 2 [Phytophthora nicotianae INRA-310]ETI53371.1 hypothetical protein, variant 1 [Phytophthora nicotianae P1569]ETK93219.1 hypothetical protein, variant 1 [Phytophthora nicotianae]ETO82061.1 hypothetical protein, variant 1 [Phytophthora nicotianae P1976]ETP23164.1 hypothetical protein, variant 1 [Phytophthora nicotianae CJ01A1]ETP51176.1 hypothetical protein, variant 1 [Phytophthora
MEHEQWTASAPGRRVSKRHEVAAQQRVLELEQARQNHQISPNDYNHQVRRKQGGESCS